MIHDTSNNCHLPSEFDAQPGRIDGRLWRPNIFQEEVEMKLEPLLDYYALLKPPLEVGAGRGGNRVIVEVEGGEFEGPRLKGRIRDLGCADWLLFDADGAGHLDVRATFETHDNAIIYVQYQGVLVMTDDVQKALAGEGQTEYGDTYFMTSPRMETGDERYKWLNHTVCVAQGRLRPNRVEYQVFQVVND
jgi:hypothetical protein